MADVGDGLPRREVMKAVESQQGGRLPIMQHVVVGGSGTSLFFSAVARVGTSVVAVFETVQVDAVAMTASAATHHFSCNDGLGEFEHIARTVSVVVGEDGTIHFPFAADAKQRKDSRCIVFVMVVVVGVPIGVVVPLSEEALVHVPSPLFEQDLAIHQVVSSSSVSAFVEEVVERLVEEELLNNVVAAVIIMILLLLVLLLAVGNRSTAAGRGGIIGAGALEGLRC